MSTTPTRLTTLAVALALVAAACGDSDDGADTAAADLAAYCALTETVDSQDGPPTVEQLNEFKRLRPDAVGDDIDLVADRFIEAGEDIGAVFSDPAVGDALERIEVHDAGACGIPDPDGDGDGEEQDSEPAEGAQVIEVTGVDFAFEGVPAEIPAGPVALGFTNGGESAHEMGVFRLGDGVDLDAVLASDGEPTDDEATDVGFVFGAPGDPTHYVNADLEPGTYALVCFIPGPEGKAHHELGMKTTLVVV